MSRDKMLTRFRPAGAIQWRHYDGHIHVLYGGIMTATYTLYVVIASFPFTFSSRNDVSTQPDHTRPPTYHTPYPLRALPAYHPTVTSIGHQSPSSSTSLALERDRGYQSHSSQSTLNYLGRDRCGYPPIPSKS
jgi:hypothetical protein